MTKKEEQKSKVRERQRKERSVREKNRAIVQPKDSFPCFTQKFTFHTFNKVFYTSVSLSDSGSTHLALIWFHDDSIFPVVFSFVALANFATNSLKINVS